MDGASASLLGAGIGGGISMATALLAPRINARISKQQFAREIEQKKLDSLEAVLDEAGLALEAVHWAIHDALAAQSRLSAASEDEDAEHWRAAGALMAAAQADVSRQGTRLAIRLGDPTQEVLSPCVAAYNSIQERYRELVRDVGESGIGSVLDTRELERRLGGVGDHSSYLNQAAALLKPHTLD